MTPNDTARLTTLLEQLVRIRGFEKDPQMDSWVQQAVVQQPDAAYLLVQRVMLLEAALDQARERVAQLEAARPAPAAAPQGWPAPTPAMPTAPGNVTPLPSAAPAQASGSGVSPWLKNVAATAAGVAGGAFLFQGIESLFGHHGGNGWGSSGAGFGGSALGPEVVENVTVNNFYEGAPASTGNDWGSGGSALSDDGGLGWDDSDLV